MKQRTSLLVAALLLLPAPALAQTSLLLLEDDFEGHGAAVRPVGWDVWASAPPTEWFLGFPDVNACLPAGDGKALVCDDELWTTGGCGLTNGGIVFTPALTPPPGWDLRVSFDYVLDVEVAAGDRARVRIWSWMVGAPGGVAIAGEATGLVNSGSWESFQTELPAASFQAFLPPAWEGLRVDFRLLRSGTQPVRGWAIDNLRVEALAPLELDRHCASGVGTTLPCPCFNEGAEGAGCSNTHDSGGARLEAAGSTSLALDELALVVAGLPPNKPALLLSGAGPASPWASGSGVSCLGAARTPLGVRFADAAGAAQWGGPGYPTARGWAPGERPLLQVIYRDPAAAAWNCDPNGPDDFNWSSALELALTP